jgi:hypothetical protein
LRSALETLGLVVAPVTLLTSLLFYFGWARSNSTLLYFGLDPSVVGLSLQDYLLRSIGALYLPLGTLLLIALALFQLHTACRRWVALGQHRRLLGWLAIFLALAGFILFVVGILREAGLPIFGRWPLITPLAIATALGALSYGGLLRKKLQPFGSNIPAEGPSASRTVAAVKSSLAWALIVLSAFWVLGYSASAGGQQAAHQLADTISKRPGTIIYATQGLEIDGPGVSVQEIVDPKSAYRFKYSGLKLLIRSSGKYFLVPGGWSRSNPTAIVLPDNGNIRVDFTAG